MKQTDPEITVLMPAYNAEKYIGEAIASVLSQTFTDFELLIINDGSTDGTQKLISSFEDPRIRLINQTNQGVAAALNIGLLNAKAGLVARFDADDICMNNRLEMQYHFLQTHPGYCIVGSDAEYINMQDEYVFSCTMPAHTAAEIQQLQFSKCSFIHSAVMFRKKEIIEAGGYNVHAYAFEDHLLWSRILKQGMGYNIPVKLIQVRLNPGSVSIDEKWRSKRFLEIKYAAIRKGNISAQEGRELFAIVKKQDSRKIKEGSYYSLLGKKYTWDNHQPGKARYNLMMAIRIHPARLDSYAIMALSYFPKEFINWLYKKKLNKI